MRLSTGILVSTVGLSALAPSLASASDRVFSYTYESSVLNPGDAELEPWTTIRAGREAHYLRFDQRLELEAGISSRLQGAVYFNTQSTSADVIDEMGVARRQERFDFAGVDLELKYELSDPVADVLGSALYLEAGLGPHEGKVEGKVLLDRHFGDAVLALNLVGEYERSWETRGTVEEEVELELVLGVAYRVKDFALGLEVRQLNELEGGTELESAAFYAGPAFAFSEGDWWSVLTIMPQIAAPIGATDGDVRDLEHQEKVQVRLLLGFHL